MQRYEHARGWKPQAHRCHYRYWDRCLPCRHLQHYPEAMAEARRPRGWRGDVPPAVRRDMAAGDNHMREIMAGGGMDGFEHISAPVGRVLEDVSQKMQKADQGPPWKDD